VNVEVNIHLSFKTHLSTKKHIKWQKEQEIEEAVDV